MEIQPTQNLENLVPVESFKPSILLQFTRHSEKEKSPMGDSFSNDKDQKVQLTEAGIQLAVEAGKSKIPFIQDLGMIISWKDRSLHTAILHAYNQIGETSLEGLKNLLIGRYGRKYLVDQKLSLDSLPGSFLFGPKKINLKSWFLESDRLAKEAEDEFTTTYSKASMNIAKIVQKYIKVLSSWENIVESKKDIDNSYSQYQNQMQRFLGTHGLVAESFLMALIQNKNGNEAVISWISYLPSQDQFGINEGYSVKIFRDNRGKIIININCNNQEFIFTKEDVDRIVK